MFDLLQRWLIPKRFFEGLAAQRQRSMLVQLLLAAGIAVLVFSFVDRPSYNPMTNLWGAAGYFLLLVVLRQGMPYLWVVNAYLLWTLFYLAYVSVLTGGVHSPVMVWMTIAVMPGILLLEQSTAFRWVLGAMVVNGLLLLAGRHAWIDNTVRMGNADIVWALSSQLCVIGIAMYVVYLADYLHRHQVDDMDRSSAELEKTHQALMRAQEHKVEFLASIGHELRTPMNAILGLNGLLRAELAADTQDVEIVDHIRHSTDQLLHLVNDILDFSQLQAGQIIWREEEFDLREILREALKPFEEPAKDKGIRLTLEVQAVENFWVVGDRQRLLQVLSNLLANALKFTEKGSVQVRAKSLDAGLMFEVQDTGIGIAVDRQRQVFLGFEHADLETNRQYGGTGLGLAICERLVDLQGGSMGLDSKLGLGSRFWFELPLRHVTAQGAKAAADASHLLASGQLKILLVDDNDVNLIVARMLLKKCLPFSDVVEASSGAMAIEKLHSQHFDLVLLDVIMPEMDGLQVTQAIRETFAPPVSDIPVLALTASANPVDQAACLDAGMNDVLLKPLDERDLVSKILKALAKRAQRGSK